MQPPMEDLLLVDLEEKEHCNLQVQMDPRQFGKEELILFVFPHFSK